MLRKILNILTSRWFVTLIGALALSALVWLLGPLFAFDNVRPWETEVARFLTILAIILAWGIGNQIATLRHRRANERVVAALVEHTARGPDPDDDASREELDILRQKLREALERLRKTRFQGKWGGRYLYQLPWYVLIGAPGSGKTTALANSGLRFPLAGQSEPQAVRGVAGTRLCDWWFADEAVLIDTAGRFTTQDSRQAVDGRVWGGFLDLLKKNRPRQPINGAIVTVSLADLQSWTETERRAQAQTIKQRLRELQERLGLRFPVYVLFTKCDLVAGFGEFFDTLGRTEREQVWGFTFPVDHGDGEAGAVAGFSTEYEQILDRLNRRLMEGMHREPDIMRRSLKFAFPARMAYLKAPIQDLLETVFEANRYEARALLRGVYFTSGTQGGAPVDKIMNSLSAAFGLDRPALPPSATVGQSFFLTRLLREVVFSEANLAGLDWALERRRKIRYRAIVGGAVAATLALAVYWLNSYSGNLDYIHNVQVATHKAADETKPLDTPPRSLTRIDDTNFATILPLLNNLRDIPGGYADRNEWPSFELMGGLYQGWDLGAQAQDIYQRALRTLFLGRLLLRLEEQIRAGSTRADYLYEALKVYLMLGGKGPLDEQLVLDWMGLDWLQTLPGPANEGNRQALRGHLQALLDGRFAPIPLDSDLVSQARDQLTRYPLAERGYTLLKKRPDVDALPEWRPVDHAGPAAGRVFVRPSGKPLSDGVDGLFTYDGYWNTVNPAIPNVAKQIAGEGWVLGEPTDVVTINNNAGKLEQGIRSLYLDEYGRNWDALLADVVIAPFRSLSHAVDVLNTLSGPNSPLKLFLTAVAKETALSPGPNEGKSLADAVAGVAGSNAPGAAAAQQAQAKAQQASQLAKVVGVSLTGDKGPPPELVINDRFANLHKLVTADGNAPPPIDDLLKQLGDLYQQLNKAASAPDQGSALLSSLSGAGGSGHGALLGALRTSAGALPPPLGGWVGAIAQNSASVTVGGAKSTINAAWTSNVLPFCRQALDNRFPFVRTSPQDVAAADFAKLFAPGGLIDQFFNTNLKPFVDMASTPWRWQKADGVDLKISPDVLTQFERAAKIRDSLFSGGNTMKIVFEVTPVELDARANQVTFEVDGQTLLYQHGPIIPMTMRWPNTEGTSQIRVSFGPPLPGQASSLAKSGPWSLFRLLDAAKLQRTDRSDKFRLTVTIGDRNAVFDFRADSVNNPFAIDFMDQFRCPASL